jgi:hypothetical protein
MGFVYGLPWGQNGNNITSWVVKDWQVNGVFASFSGVPFTITANGATLNMPGNQQTANQAGAYDITGRNAFRGPGNWRVDLSVFRGFPLGGERRIEFRVEAFNLTNSIQYGDGTTGNPWGFSSRDVTNPNFGKVFVASGERNIRLGLRFSFRRTRRARVKSALCKVSGPATVGGHLYNSNA